MIVFSIDTDWTPDPIIEECIKILDSYGITATFFVTNKTDVDFGLHEVAAHPNFYNNSDPTEVLNNIRRITPNSIGLRSHSLYTSSRHQLLFKEFNFKYTSNFFYDRMANIKPSFYLDLIEFPIYFMDNLNIMRFGNRKDTFSVNSLMLEQQGIKVLTFHPMNIFLNLEKIERMEEVKPYWEDASRISEQINKQSKGTKTLLYDTLEYIKSKNIETATFKELYNLHKHDFHRFS